MTPSVNAHCRQRVPSDTGEGRRRVSAFNSGGAPSRRSADDTEGVRKNRAHNFNREFAYEERAEAVEDNLALGVDGIEAQDKDDCIP